MDFCAPITFSATIEVRVKSKKLIILISAVVVVIALVVILSSVFTVRKVSAVYHSFDGSLIDQPADAPTENDVLKLCKGKSIFFMSKDKLLNDLCENYPGWHAFAVVKNFPNIVETHFVKRQAAVKVDIGGNYVYVDTYGYVVSAPTDYSCLDISSVFEYRDVSNNEIGKQLKFVEEGNNERLKVVLEAIIASWRCNVELQDMPVVFGEENVFTFDADGNLIVNTRSGATIKVVKPSIDLADRLFKAYSVYYNSKLNLQQKGVVITVEQNGNIITPNTNK